MSDLLSHIYDMYEDYKELCKKLNMIPKDIGESKWVKHMRELEIVDEITHRENE